MNRRIPFIILLLVILPIITACASEVTEIDGQTGVSLLQTSSSSEQSRSINTTPPLSLNTVGEILLVENDLPVEYTRGQIEDRTVSHQSTGLDEELIVHIPLEVDGQQAGFVTVFIYDSEADAELGYYNENSTFIRAAEEPHDESAFGTLARSYFGPLSCCCYQNIYETVFRRCRSVIHIRITPPHLYDEALGLNYAQRLDERIGELVCPEK